MPLGNSRASSHGLPRGDVWNKIRTRIYIRNRVGLSSSSTSNICSCSPNFKPSYLFRLLRSWWDFSRCCFLFLGIDYNTPLFRLIEGRPCEGLALLLLAVALGAEVAGVGVAVEHMALFTKTRRLFFRVVHILIITKSSHMNRLIIRGHARLLEGL